MLNPGREEKVVVGVLSARVRSCLILVEELLVAILDKAALILVDIVDASTIKHCDQLALLLALTDTF